MKLLLFVLFCGAAYFAGHYAVRQYEKEAEAKRSHWPRQIAKFMEHHVAKHSVAALSADEGVATFYQILYQSHTAKEEVTDLGATLREAATIAGATANEASAIAAAIEQNLATARQLGVFEDITNLLRLERGEPRRTSKARLWQRVREEHLMIPMRDGKRLSAYVFFPKGEGKWPAIFEQRYATSPAPDRARLRQICRGRVSSSRW
jgi:hypothetical protein